MEYVKYQPEHNPEAIISYCSHGVKSGRSKNPDVKDLILKAKKHLSSIGWLFFYTYKINPDRRELRYRSPVGRSYCSLRTACQSVLDHQGQYIHVLENPKELDTKLEKKDDSWSDNRPGKKIRMEDVESLYLQQERDQSVVNNVAENIKIDGARVQDLERLKESGCSNVEKPKEGEGKPEKSDDDSVSSNRPKKKVRMEDVETSYLQQQRDQYLVGKKRIAGTRVQDLKRLMKASEKKNDLKPKKLIRKVESSSSTRSRRCVLSLLIEYNILSRGARVSYCKKDGRILAKGRVYDEGIQCDCCDQLFLLSKFEAHAGSTYHRPAANIFLEDGRSIVDCQTQLQRENKVFIKTQSKKATDSVSCNDDFCSVCNDGGELVLCDSCTSSFHSNCIGLSQIPDSAYWFCPSCCCRICHEGQISNFTTEGSHDHGQLKCGQCERQFHIDCVKRLGFSVSNTNADQNEWLCSENCERIYSALKSFSKTVMLAADRLSWKLLKLDDNNKHEFAKTSSKLNVALDVMHECFQPVKHRWSDNDLIEDLIFSRSSKRSNFKGFFTAVLERGDEMIMVATLRVHGCKVAEIPLVATRFRYRRLGMCRVLIDEIERKMKDLGVERVVLPAVPEMVSTWTESFGFKVMTELERVNLVEYKLVDFPGTILCHKILK
ncbi:putative histone acetyltransferase chromatin regulator PHD family [Helianthus debilis subsp. tardiflorus]